MAASVTKAAFPPVLDDPDRPPLPAGDPLSWDLLVCDTWLAGTDWPGWASITEQPVRKR